MNSGEFWIYVTKEDSFMLMYNWRDYYVHVQ